MLLDEITEKLIKIIKGEIEINVTDSINSDTPLMEIGVDSIAMMTIWVYAEEQFEFITDEETLMSDEKFNTVGDLAKYINEKVKES